MRGLDPQDIFARAEAAYAAGRLREARQLIDRVAELVGPHPAVLHLSGLVHRGLGAHEQAVDALVAAARLAPTDADIFNNLGNALADASRSEEALEAYRAATRLRPGWADAHRNAALTLLAMGRSGEAAREAETAVRADGRASASWSVLGRALLTQEQLDGAGDAFDRALTLSPALAPALAGRAAVALQRGEADAAGRYQHALAAAPRSPALLIGMAQARSDGTALDQLADQLATEPDWIDGHRAYASLASELEHPVDATLARARAAQSHDLALIREHLTVLVNAERADDALDEIDRLPPALIRDEGVSLAEAAAGTLAGDHARARSALDRIADSAKTAELRARLELRKGDPAAAAAVIEPLAESGAAGVGAWALLSLAWKLLGDPREAWLHGDPAMVSTRSLDLPDGDRQQLVDLLRRLHAERRAHPIGQSMRGGTQTRGRLLARGEPVIRRLGTALAVAVEAHRADLPPADPRHPLLRHRGRPWAITGSWSVRLTGAGFHIHHIHPHGVVSSAAYLHLPESNGQEPHAGWLALGASPVELGLDLPPTRLIEPVLGQLALFPSTLFHGTVPFRSGERITVAFDVAADR